jgi:hypothetical protein
MDPNAQTTSYQYDPNTDNLLNVNKVIDSSGRVSTNSYTYEQVTKSINTKVPPPSETGYKASKNPDKGKRRVQN